MDSVTSYKKVCTPKVVETVSFNGKYFDVSTLRSRIFTASALSAGILAFGTFIYLLLT